MKITKIINSFYRSVIVIKYRVCISLLVMFTTLIVLSGNYIKGFPIKIKLSVFDMLCDVYKGLGVMGISRYMCFIIPAFAFTLISIVDIDNKLFCIVRYKFRKSIWNKQVSYTIVLALIYSFIVVIGGYIVSGIFIGSFENSWASDKGLVYKLMDNPQNWNDISSRFSSYKILINLFISNFLGLSSIGLFICAGKLFLKNQYVWLILIIGMFLYGVSGKFSIVLRQMTINLANWIEPSTIIRNNIYLALIIIMLYMVGEAISDRKDILTEYN